MLLVCVWGSTKLYMSEIPVNACGLLCATTGMSQRLLKKSTSKCMRKGTTSSSRILFSEQQLGRTCVCTNQESTFGRFAMQTSIACTCTRRTVSYDSTRFYTVESPTSDTQYLVACHGMNSLVYDHHCSTYQQKQVQRYDASRKMNRASSKNRRRYPYIHNMQVDF